MPKYVKIIDTDNFGGDYPDELQLGWIDSKGKASIMFVQEEYAAELIAVLDKIYQHGMHSRRHHMARPQDYELQGGFEP